MWFFMLHQVLVREKSCKIRRSRESNNDMLGSSTHFSGRHHRRRFFHAHDAWLWDGHSQGIFYRKLHHIDRSKTFLTPCCAVLCDLSYGSPSHTWRMKRKGSGRRKSFGCSCGLWGCAFASFLSLHHSDCIASWASQRHTWDQFLDCAIFSCAP